MTTGSGYCRFVKLLFTVEQPLLLINGTSLNLIQLTISNTIYMRPNYLAVEYVLE
jgi:hypothetical protein